MADFLIIVYKAKYDFTQHEKSEKSNFLTNGNEGPIVLSGPPGPGSKSLENKFQNRKVGVNSCINKKTESNNGFVEQNQLSGKNRRIGSLIFCILCRIR
jgi:hypothetical protein